jgi:hypothetical protein
MVKSNAFTGGVVEDITVEQKSIFKDNIVVGDTLSPWTATYKVIDLSTAGAVYGTNTAVSVTSNLYVNAAASNFIAKTTGAGSSYYQALGVHSWYSSASVTEGTAASLVLRMKLDINGDLLAGADNTQTLGGASNRWSVVYAGTGTINTSDAREKTAVQALTANELEASKQLGKEIGTYKWLSAIAEKGYMARNHIGMTVQRAIEIMTTCNLEPMAYGFICYDEWVDEFVEHTAVEAVAAVDATETEPAVEAVAAADAWTEQVKWAGDRYGFRYDELLAFIAAGFNARLEALEAV